MSDRIIKGFAVSENPDESIVINSNDRMEEAIERYRQLEAKKREERRRAIIEDYISKVEENEDGERVYPTDEDGNALIPVDDDGNPLFAIREDGTPVLPGDEDFGDSDDEESEESEEDIVLSPEELLQNAQEEAERIVNDANEQADQIIADANTQADTIREQAADEGRGEGYRDGQARAAAEYSRMEEELGEKEEALSREYEEKKRSMEKDLTATIADVIGKFFKAEFSGKQEILFHIVDNALLDIENSKEFLVRVSKGQYEYMNGRLSELRDKVGGGMSVDVIMDPMLSDDQCMIETDGGVFDCSFDTQLDSLIRDIKALSI